MNKFDGVMSRRRSKKERRTGFRDRRLLDGIMKYRGDFTKIEIANLSEKGAYVQSSSVPDLTDCVNLTISLPTVGSSVMVSGRVRRVALGSRVMSRPGGFGIEFTRFYTEVGRECLRQHLAA